MPLLTVATAKSYLRVEHAADDTLLATLLAQATALVETHLGRPITAREGEWTDEAVTARGWGVVTTLTVPSYPLDAATVVVTDADETTLTAGTDYRVDARAGLIRAMPGLAFSNGPYTITAEHGLSAHPDYAAQFEPLVNAALLDVVADLYQRRNPAAQAEGAGGGIYTQWSATTGLPVRAKQALAPIMSRIVG